MNHFDEKWDYVRGYTEAVVAPFFMVISMIISTIDFTTINLTLSSTTKPTMINPTLSGMALLEPSDGGARLSGDE